MKFDCYISAYSVDKCKGVISSTDWVVLFVGDQKGCMQALKDCGYKTKYKNYEGKIIGDYRNYHIHGLSKIQKEIILAKGLSRNLRNGIKKDAMKYNQNWSSVIYLLDKV